MNMQHIAKTSLVLLVSLIIVTSATAQDLPPEDLTGKDLRVWLKENWFDGYHHVNTSERFNDPVYDDRYRDARREMYNFIDNENDQVIGVYSGYAVDFEYGGDDSNPAPINCEHTVPQSFFRPSGEDDSSEPMRSDLHHLFPSYGSWNSTRSNYAFEEIEDIRTTKWMYLDKSSDVVPTDNIDLYSEFSSEGSNRFEPREDHKGDLARAILYFYAMYEDNELVYRPIENVGSIAQFVAWHSYDPVSQKEIDRNEKIATYQGNKNPFISHPELINRAWGSVITSAQKVDLKATMVYPNPVIDQLKIQNDLNYKQASIFNTAGQNIRAAFDLNATQTIDVSELESGVYFIKLINNQTVTVQRFKKI